MKNETKTEDLLIDLIKSGVNTGSDDFKMKCRKFISFINNESPKLAARISKILQTSSALRKADLITDPLPVDPDSRQKLLNVSNLIDIDQPIWSEEISELIYQFILERKKANMLMENGLTPSRSIILDGPPGVGKTLTAKFIAKELSLPLFTLNLATIMSSFLGKTGNNIRAALEYSQKFPSVLLIDEFDAIAKRRDDETDVGELKRLVTVLLQTIDDWPLDSILITATNHGELIDPAIWRRFDLRINFSLPNSELINQYLRTLSIPEIMSENLAVALVGKSFSDIETLIKNTKKNAILTNAKFFKLLFSSLKIDDDSILNKSKFLKIVKLFNEGLSQRKIAEELKISRALVSNIVSEITDKRKSK